MASFDKYSNFRDNAGVSSVVFGSEKPVLEVELNEVQEAIKTQMRKIVKNILGDGISDLSKITYNSANTTLSVGNNCFFSANGNVITCTGLSITATDGQTVYFQSWEDTVSYGDTLKSEGNQQSSSNVTNWFRDSRSPSETSKRKVVKYTLSTSIDSSKHNIAIAKVTDGFITRLCNEVNFTKLSNQVIELKAQTGVYDDGVIGVMCDLDNNTFKRVGDNEFWTSGAEYTAKSPIYANRFRCNVTDSGVIVAKYGDEAYTETGALTVEVTGAETYPVGTKVQSMVYQPAFYYKRIPLKLTKQVDASYSVKGYHMTKWIDLISPVYRDGFKIHPAFKIGDEVIDGYFISENNGSIMNAEGYALTDEIAIGSSPYTGIQFSSIAGAKPASGKTNNLTRGAVRTLCANRGADWMQLDFTIASAEQLLFAVEYATLNIQNCSVFGAGISSMPYADENDSAPCPENTELGNESGIIPMSYVHSNGTTYQLKVPVYRGVKNPYANIWNFVDGFMRKNAPDADCNEAHWQDGSKPFSDNIADYIPCGFSCATTNGYVKAFGYSPECDFAFMTSLVGGDSNKPVGDNHWTNMGRNNYIALLGAHWDYGAYCGLFCWTLNDVASIRALHVGGRLTRKSKNIKIDLKVNS